MRQDAVRHRDDPDGQLPQLRPHGARGLPRTREPRGSARAGAGEHRARDVEDEQRLGVLPALDRPHLADDGLRGREREACGASGEREPCPDHGGGSTGGQTEHAAERSRPALAARYCEECGHDGDRHERGDRAEERERPDGH